MQWLELLGLSLPSDNYRSAFCLPLLPIDAVLLCIDDSHSSLAQLTFAYFPRKNRASRSPRKKELINFEAEKLVFIAIRVLAISSHFKALRLSFDLLGLKKICEATHQ